MIRTVTFNTGFDETLVVGHVDAGGVAAILDRSAVPSGKGINCARTINALGTAVAAYALVGELEVDVFRRMLVDEGIDVALVPVANQRTRRNTTIRPDTGVSTHYRAAGFRLDGSGAIDQLMTKVVDDVRAGDIVSLHGSTPRGAPLTARRTLAEAAARKGALVFVDIYGPPLVALLESRVAVVCKPNEAEAALVPGAIDADGARAVSAVRAMSGFGVTLPLVTCGAQGVVFAAGGELWRASLAAERVVIQVGAGDACMAGLMAAYAGGEREPQALVRAALAAAVAHVENTPLNDLQSRAAALAAHAQFERI